MGRMKDLLIDLEERGLNWDDYLSQGDDLRKSIRENAILSARPLPEGFGKAEDHYLTKLETQAEDEYQIRLAAAVSRS